MTRYTQGTQAIFNGNGRLTTQWRIAARSPSDTATRSLKSLSTARSLARACLSARPACADAGREEPQLRCRHRRISFPSVSRPGRHACDPQAAQVQRHHDHRHDGEVTEIHVGVGSIVNSQFIKNLRISVQRALNGRVRDGLIPGRLTYGYSRGSKACEREIDPDEAKIVLRIFEEYASGKPARDIAAEGRRAGRRH